MTITAAADGSALGNPGPAGWAWFIDDNTWRAGGWPHGTNNMGELKAVLDLLEATAVDADQHLVILCDSQYVINSVTKWMPGWKRKGWRKKDGKPVLNVELLQAIDRALAGRSVEFEWVKGHAGHAMNEAADERARAAATAFSRGRDPQIGPGYRSSRGSGGAAQPAPEETPRVAQQRPAAAPTDDDLFSFLEADAETPASTSQGARTSHGASTPEQEVFALDMALCGQGEPMDTAALAALLHREASGVSATGTELSRADLLDTAETFGNPGITCDTGLFTTSGLRDCADERTAMQQLETAHLAPDVMLLRSRIADPAGGGAAVHRSSLWVREQGRWLLRHCQHTPEQ